MPPRPQRGTAIALDHTVQVEVTRSVPRTVRPAHHVMKEEKPMLAENLRLGKSLMSGLQYDNQQTGTRACIGATENARHENTGRSKMQGWKMRDMKK